MSFLNNKKVKMEPEKTITSVLLVNYIKTMSISLFIGIILFLAITGKEMVYRQRLNNNRILNSVTYFINMQLEDIRKFCDNLVMEDELQEIFDRKEEIRNNLIGAFLMRKMAERNEISSIHVIWKSSIVSEFRYPVYDYDSNDILDMLDLEDNIGKRSNFYWEIGKDTSETDADNVFYLVGSIRSKMGMKHLGYLVVFIDTMELKKNFNLYLEEEKYEVLIRSNSGNTIQLPDNGEMEQYSDKLIHNKKKDDEKWWRSFWTNQYSSQQLSSIGGEIFGISKRAVFSPNVEFAIVFMLIITIEFVIIASIIMGKNVTTPLEEIATKAREIGVKGKLDIQFPSNKFYSEVDDISTALNEMMEQIRVLMQDVEKREKQQKILELSVINHQIKPHFLYNTLNAVSILISVEEKDSANQLINFLASYYRACLNQGNDIITLQNELNIVQDYIKIVLIRNPDIVRVSYDIENKLIGLQIPKMTIQTLVENSIKYGIRTIGEPIYINITVRRNIRTAEIIVEDNGIGMKRDIINRILKGEQLEVKSGFGLKSVVRRISLSYDMMDRNEIIKIESEEGKYTRITLRIPIDNDILNEM